MKSFSLLNLFFVILVVALGLSQILLMRQLKQARAEVDEVRAKYGYISVEDPSKTYVFRIAGNNESGHSYRIVVPADSHYMLHITEADFEHSGYPDDPRPTKTISLNGWTEGADTVLSYSVFSEDGAPRIVVHTEVVQFFDYVAAEWGSVSEPEEGFNLEANPQVEFSTDETIRIMWMRNPTTGRGLMLWLEPNSQWIARRERDDGT